MSAREDGNGEATMMSREGKREGGRWVAGGGKSYIDVLADAKVLVLGVEQVGDVLIVDFEVRYPQEVLALGCLCA